MAVMCAVDAGARVFGVDGVEARREAAERLGAGGGGRLKDAAEAIAAGRRRPRC